MKENQFVSRRSFIKGAAVVGFSFSALGQLVGCGSENEPDMQSSEDTQEKRLTILFNDAPTSLDPAVGWDGWYTVCRGITETLVQFDQDMNIRECLATDWAMDDELTWRFTIREKVLFQTGNPLTPEAVKASLERTIAENTRSADKLKVESIEVEGSDVVIKSTQTIATMLGEIADPSFSIIDVTTVETSPDTSGTGPYMGKQIDAMENFLLTRFEEYWGELPTVVELHNQTVTEPSARTMALQSGDADVAWSIQASDLPLFESDPSYTVVKSESARMVFAFLNNLNPLLKQKEIRQALSFATDRESICNKLLNGILVTNGTLFPSYLSYSKNVADQAQHYDKEAAQNLLKDAGYEMDSNGKLSKNGEALSLRIAYYESRPELPIIAQALQDQYGQVGIDITLELFENTDELFQTDKFDILLYNTTTIGNGDPSYYLELYYASEGSENAGSYSNAEVDEIITQIRKELEQDTRFELAEAAQRLILNDCANLFFGSPIMNLVESSRAGGFTLYPVEYYGVTNEIS